jgi:hypothetical protein
MKNQILFFAVFIVIAATAEISAQNYLKDRFTIGTYNFVMYLDKRRQADLQNYNDLNFNSQICFTYRGDDNENHRYVDGFLQTWVIMLRHFQKL